MAVIPIFDQLGEKELRFELYFVKANVLARGFGG